MYSDFELNGIEEEKLNTKSFQTISQRMTTEEAACVLLDGHRGDDDGADDEDGDELPEGALDEEGGAAEPKAKGKVATQLSHTLSEDPANVVANVKAEVSNVAGNMAGKVGNVLGGFSKGFGGKLGGFF